MISERNKCTSEPRRRITAVTVYYIYWGIVFPCIVIFLIHYLAGIIHDYATAPYGSKIITKPLQYFPTIDLCPRIWYDPRAASAVFGDEDTLGYALSLGGYGILNAWYHGPGKQFDALNGVGGVDSLGSGANYTKLLSKYKNHTGLLKAIALDPSALLMVHCLGCEKQGDYIPVDVITKARGVCFRVNEWKIQHDRLTPSDIANLKIMVDTDYLLEAFGEEKSSFDRNGIKILDDDFSTFVVSVGDNVFRSCIDETINLDINDNNAIYLDFTGKTTLDHCDKHSTFPDVLTTVQHCAVRRFMENCKDSTCINYIGPASDATDNMTRCDPLNYQEYNAAYDCLFKQMQDCESGFVYPCEEMIINVIPQWSKKKIYAGTFNQYGTIKIFPQHYRSILYLEEFQSFTWNGFVSNIGGLFGVSLGASLFSLADRIYNLARWIKQKRRNKTINKL